MSGRLSPGALERRMTAELNLLESMEESVRQLADVDRTRGVSLAQQETVSLAQVLKVGRRHTLFARNLYTYSKTLYLHFSSNLPCPGIPNYRSWRNWFENGFFLLYTTGIDLDMFAWYFHVLKDLNSQSLQSFDVTLGVVCANSGWIYRTYIILLRSLNVKDF